MGVEESRLLVFALFPRSICTEILASDKSTPELCSACVSVLNNLLAKPICQINQKQRIDQVSIHIRLVVKNKFINSNP